jgi:hypothetical protein
VSHNPKSVAPGYHPICRECGAITSDKSPAPGEARIAVEGQLHLFRYACADLEWCCDCGYATDQGYYVSPSRKDVCAPNRTPLEEIKRWREIKDRARG